MMRYWWLWLWRVAVVAELAGFLIAGLVAAFSWQALHVTWMAMYHHPDLVLQTGTIFVSASIAAGVFLMVFLLSLPVLGISELVSLRTRSREEQWRVVGAELVPVEEARRTLRGKRAEQN